MHKNDKLKATWSVWQEVRDSKEKEEEQKRIKREQYTIEKWE